MEGAGFFAAVLFFLTLLGGGGKTRRTPLPQPPPGPGEAPPPPAIEADCSEYERQMQSYAEAIEKAVIALEAAQAAGDMGAVAQIEQDITGFETMLQEARVAFELCKGRGQRTFKEWMP